MRTRIACVLAFALLMLAGCRQKASQTARKDLEHSGVSSIRRVTDGDVTFPVTENTRFYAEPRYWTGKGKSVDLIIQETIETQ